MRRVVITGAGAVSPLGVGVPALVGGVEAGRGATRRMESWDGFKGLRSRVAALAPLENERAIPRRYRRTMGRMSLFAYQAAVEAMAEAGLGSADTASGRMGCAVGSTMGSAISLNRAFEAMIPNRDLSELSSTLFFQCVSHTAAMNVGQALGLGGCVFAPSAACASALQAIGLGFDLVRSGRQDVMLCGGAEEVHATVTGSFDLLYAASTRYNDAPERTPRPFDADRDGLVCGEGSGILVLESLDRARRRGAPILAEVLGFHTCGGGDHVSESNRKAMADCMRGALADAGLDAGRVDAINAHATATLQGDGEEVAAIREVFGGAVPTSSLKGHLTHTLGASAALELIVALAGMRRGRVYPTRNLERVAPECEGILHVRDAPAPVDIRVLAKNSFAFGGICAVLLCGRTEETPAEARTA